MANENAILEEDVILEDDYVDFEDLEEKLQKQLGEELFDLSFLEEEKDKIGNPDNLGNMIKDVVWEQFLNQVAATAGEDFIKENRGLTLDLRNEAHIQTTENFAEGKIATHNTECDYQQRYDDWQSNFQKDDNGNIVKHPTRSGKEEATLVKDARKPFDENRPSGSTEKHTDMDHTISAGEIIRDAEANAHMTKEEQIAFANSNANLNEMDSSLNRSKGDKSMTEWLDNPNANGQKPDEIFDISAEDDAQLRQKDKEAREEYERQKKEAEKRSIVAGKKSQREEAFRIGGKALRAVLMQMLAELIKEIIGKLVKWFKSAKKELSTLLDSLKEAIHSFIGKMKTHLINAGNTVFSTVATAIIGPIFRTIKKAWMMLKQGWKSLKDAINYIKDPANKGKSISILLMEVGKIIIAGLTGVGALLLGEVIEKGLMSIPIFAFEIPLLGSLANILGIFLGAIVAGIIGAIAINMMDKVITKQKKDQVISSQVDKGNEILQTQREILNVNEKKLVNTQEQVFSNIQENHKNASQIIKTATDEIFAESESDNQKDFDEIDSMLDDLLA